MHPTSSHWNSCVAIYVQVCSGALSSIVLSIFAGFPSHWIVVQQFDDVSLSEVSAFWWLASVFFWRIQQITGEFSAYPVQFPRLLGWAMVRKKGCCSLCFKKPVKNIVSPGICHMISRYFKGLSQLVVYQILSVDWFIKVHLISWGEGQGHIDGWWFGTWILFSIYWECHHPNWLSYSSEGRYTINQPGSEASHFVYVSKGKPPTSIGIIPYQRPGAVRRHWAFPAR